MAGITRKTRRYSSNLTDKEWESVTLLMSPVHRRGRKRTTDFREIINALRYRVRPGCGWEMLPVHFGPWQTVYWWFCRLMRRFLFQTIHDVCLMLDREAAEREASPSGGVIDSQSIKAPMWQAGVLTQARRSLVASATSRLIRMAGFFWSGSLLPIFQTAQAVR